MKRTLQRAAVLTAAVATIGLGPAAHADVWQAADPRGDAENYGKDITRVKVTNGATNVVVRVTYRGGYALAGGDHVTEADIDTVGTARGAEFTVSDDYVGPDHVTLWRNRSGGPNERDCAGASAVIDDGDLLVKVPRSCLGIRGEQPGRLRANVSYLDRGDGHDEAPEGYGPWIRPA